MIDYNENMSCTKEEYDHLNEMIENINRHLGNNVFSLKSTEGYENECVDIWEEDVINSNYFSFDDAINYLEGVERGILIKELYSV